MLTDAPVYTFCSECKTKINQQTQQCKRAASGGTCQTRPGGLAVFAPVRLSDFSGNYGDIMVGPKQLCRLAMLPDLEALERQVREHGVQSLCFQQRFDVVVGANQKDAPRARGSTVPTQVNAATCRFEILRAVASLAEAWGTADRPVVSRVLRARGDSPDGQVLPIRSIAGDLEDTPAGLKLRRGEAFPRSIVILCAANATVVSEPAGYADMLELTFSGVRPVLSNGEGDAAAFEVQLLCTRRRADELTFGDGVPHVVVGTASFPGGRATLQAENLWPANESTKTAFEYEIEHVWKLLGCISQEASKRPAKDLMIQTPSKRV